jgi:hypothetical protein
MRVAGCEALMLEETRASFDAVRDARSSKLGECAARENARASPRLFGLMPVMRTRDGLLGAEERRRSRE